MPEEVKYVISLQDQNFGSGIDSATKKVNGMESALGNAAKLAAGFFAIDAIGGFAKDVTMIGAQFDSYEISLATLLKDSGKAHDLFNQIKKDAAATPFDTESLVLANRALISAGEDAQKARQVVLDLGNAIAATGGTSENLKGMAVNLNQIKSIGKATALDIKQFVFAGIPIYQLLAEATGKNVDEVKEMEVSYDVLAMALNKAGKEGGMFAGGLDKMANSTAGQISNLEESITFLKYDLYDGLRPVIQEVLVGVANFVQVFVEGIKWAKENKDGLTRVFAPLKKFIDPIIYSINVLRERFDDMMGQGSMLENIFNRIGSVIEFMSPVLEVVGELIGQVIFSIGVLGSAFMNVIDRFQKPIMGVATMFRNVFVSIADSAKHFLGGVADLISGILTGDVDQIKSGMSGLKMAFSKGNPLAIAQNAGKGFAEGYEKGFKTTDFFGDKKNETGTTGNGVTTQGAGGVAASPVPSGVGGVPSGSKVSSVKPTTINISIENLVRNLEIITQNLGIPKTQVAAEISKILIGSVNDANRLAGM